MVAEGKTATVIRSIVSGAFDVFLRDPDLAETFGQPSTFSFEDVVQAGKIIALVPGERYEQLGRLLGTACKLDFQSAMLARAARFNSARLALYFADECHKYLAAGSAAAGDPSFMSLSRSNNVANICATQSYAWIIEVLGREAANVYLSAFGVQFWLQQTDPETCRRAAEICGRVTREKVSAEHTLDFSGLAGALARGREVAIRRQVGRRRASASGRRTSPISTWARPSPTTRAGRAERPRWARGEPFIRFAPDSRTGWRRWPTGCGSTIANCWKILPSSGGRPDAADCRPAPPA